MPHKDISKLFRKQGWSLHCSTCGKDVFKNPKDYYMLKDEVWNEICNNDYISKSSVLCRDCAEKILGRKFTREDMNLKAPCNCNFQVEKKRSFSIRFFLYLFRWQLSTPVLWLCLLFLLPRCGEFISTIIGNFVGGCIFYFIDKRIFRKSK